MQRRHVVWLVVGVSAVSTSAILIKAANDVDVPALTIAFYRCALASAILVPIAWARQRGELASLPPRSRWLVFASGVALACHFAAWVSSLSYTSIAASAVLVQTMPVWVALVGPLTGERTTRRGWVGILVAVGGTIVITVGSPTGGAYPNPVLGDVLAVLGAMFAAAYLVIGRRVRREMSFVAYSASVDIVAAVCLAAAMLVSGTPFAGFPAQAWVLFVAMTAGPQFLGHTVFNHLLGELKASIVSVALLAEPVGSTLLAIAIFDQVPGIAVVIGAGIVLVGVVITVLAEAAERPEVLAGPEG
jgi:drug/metabolite transporter (DMT)-like permease